MFYENLKITGELQIVLRDEFGNIKDERIVPNLVVTAGKVLIALRLSGSGVSPTHMAIGSGSTGALAADTALGTELTTTGGNARPAFTSTTPSTNTVTYVAVFAPGVGTGTVYEAGIFNAATAGTMLCRTTFGIVTKAAADTLTINWVITVN